MKTLIILIFSCVFSQVKAFEARPLKNIAIYYGYLSSLNLSSLHGEADQIENFLSQYDIIVLGAGLESRLHPDYKTNKVVIPKLSMKRKVFGYVSLGKTRKHSRTKIKEKIMAWRALGVIGIFYDEFGYDFWDGEESEMRARQNFAVRTAHQLNLKVIANAWDPRDIFVKDFYQPTLLGAGDYYLFESYIFSSYFEHNIEFELMKVRMMKAQRDRLGVLSIGVSTTKAPSFLYHPLFLSLMSFFAKIDGLEGIGWGTAQFSASGSDNGVMPFRTIFQKDQPLIYRSK